MSSFAYDSFLDNVLAGNIQKTDTYFVMLTSAGYTPNQGADAYRSAVTSEVSGAGYAAGGQAVVPTFTKDASGHREIINFPAVTWPNSTITARRAVYYKHRGGAASADELVAVDDFGADVATSNGAFQLSATSITLNSPA